MTRIGAALYRFLLLFFPPDFRRRHGGAMLAQFAEQQRGLRGRPVTRIVHWMRAAVDALRHGLALRRRRGTGSRLNTTSGRRAMDTVWQDIRYGVRMLGRQGGFTAVAVMTLALGIGAVTALASVIDSALIRPLPFPHPEQLVRLSFEVRRDDGRVSRPDPALTDVRFWQDASQSFSHIAAWRRGRSVVVRSDPPERVVVTAVTEDYFGLHGAAPVLGRDIRSTDMLDGTEPVAILGHGYWQRSFNADLNVIGATLRLADGAATIVGIAPPGFFPGVDVFEPLRLRELQVMRISVARTTARLRAGVTIDDALAELERLTSPVDPRFASAYAGHRVQVESLYDITTSGYRGNVSILAGAVALIVLIACVNVAGLLLARGSGRRGELAVRAAIGAGRGRLVRQLLTESVVLALAGGLVGVGTAGLWLDGLVSLMPMTVPGEAPVELNSMVLLASTVASVAIGVAFGLVPALMLSRAGTRAALETSGRRHGSSLSTRGGQILIAIEIALAVVLVSGAGLMLRSLDHLLEVDLGFDPAGIVAVDAVPTDPADNARYYPALVERLRALPGVEFAGTINHVPLAGTTMLTTGQLDGGTAAGIQVQTAGPGYFEAMGLRLLDGRLPAEGEAVPWAVLSETAARDLAPTNTTVGRTLEFFSGRYLVVGVVSGVRHEGPTESMPPGLYVSVDEDAAEAMTVVLRLTPGARLAGDLIRREALAVGPPVLFDGIRSGDDLLAESLQTPRQRTGLLSLLGGLGLVLALVGLFGVTAFAVTGRTREIGIRMAFGARPGQVVRRIVLDSALPALVGIAAGLGLTLLLTGAIESYLFETTPTDPATLAGVSVLLGACCCLAAWVPGRRAARIDPSAALRVQ